MTNIRYYIINFKIVVLPQLFCIWDKIKVVILKKYIINNLVLIKKVIIHQYGS